MATKSPTKWSVWEREFINSIWNRIMCGIVGILSKNTNRSAGRHPQVVAKRNGFTRSQWRGDMERHWFVKPSPGYAGHRRLSILDTSQAGHQPMLTQDKNIVTIYKWRGINFKELRDELLGFGYNFISDSDTEVLLYAYKQWGRDFISKCNGMFAIAIYDRLNGKILFYRDRMGIKPLYYGIQGDRFYFGSTLSAISCISRL